MVISHFFFPPTQVIGNCSLTIAGFMAWAAFYGDAKAKQAALACYGLAIIPNISVQYKYPIKSKVRSSSASNANKEHQDSP